jgi:hypothetical protein
MPPLGFEPTIPAGERPQTYALDCAATGTDTKKEDYYYLLYVYFASTSLKQILC